MHLSIYLNILDYQIFIGLKPTVEIMELDTGDYPGHHIEKLGRNGFANGVVALPFPT
jgi:hypothetical protein